MHFRMNHFLGERGTILFVSCEGVKHEYTRVRGILTGSQAGSGPVPSAAWAGGLSPDRAAWGAWQAG